jgi:hypothetical protein
MAMNLDEMYEGMMKHAESADSPRLCTERDDPNNRNRLSYWFPKIPSGIRVPETCIINYADFWPENDKTPETNDLINLLDGIIPPEFHRFCASVISLGNKVGWPFFLRTDYMSGKHFWEDTCYIKDGISNIANHIKTLVDISASADILGFPTDIWVVRKMIPTVSGFRASWGKMGTGMPIVKERRYFVQDAQVVCHHPYWPREAIDNCKYVSVCRWEESFDRMNKETHEEIDLLSGFSSKVGEAIGGNWSVDWLWSEQKGQWFLIDMAEARSSYHWPGCDKEMK